MSLPVAQAELPEVTFPSPWALMPRSAFVSNSSSKPFPAGVPEL